jgi:hypothetical protein
VGAWADFLRHEEIRDMADLATIRRAIWAVELGDERVGVPDVPLDVACGDRSTYRQCQEAARRLRKAGYRRLQVPAAALLPGGAQGHRMNGQSIHCDNRDGHVLVLFGTPEDLRLVGWPAAVDAAPPRDLLRRVRPL